LRLLVLSFCLCVLYAITDEVHQMFVPHRLADYRDVISDAVGTGLGLTVLRSAQALLLRRASA
jgi:VanZ family protein